MTQSTTVLAQFQKLVPKNLFDQFADKYRVNKHVSVFKAATHFAVLLFAQIAGLKSTREIQHATSSPFSPPELVQVKKSTLSDANRRIDWHFYYDLFQALLVHYQHLFGHHKFSLPGNLFSLDSTLISVCLKHFPWAKYRTNSGGLKLHTLLNHAGINPQDIVMTCGKVSDITVAWKLKIERGATYLVDRGYFDSKWFYKIHKNKAFFVTRMKSSVGFYWTKRHKVNRKAGILKDWTGYFGEDLEENYPEPLRLIRFIDPETGKDLEFLTNLMDLEAEEIAELYKQRWQVELFFKWVKQNLKIKTFLGTNINAVMSQIWVAMITFLLLKVIQLSSKGAITTHQLLVFLRTHILLKIALCQAWQPFKGKDKSKVRKRE